MKRVKVQNETARSMKIYAPVDGLITIDELGVAEVSEKCADALVKNTVDWKMVENLSDSGSNSSVPEDDGNSGEETAEEIKTRLSGMKVSELKELAEEAGCTEEEIKAAKNKNMLVALLMDKYATASEEEEDPEEEEESVDPEEESEEEIDDEEIDDEE